VALEIRAWRIPLRIRFRGLTERRGLALRGPYGWGEFSPFPDYSPAADARWLLAAWEAVHLPFPPPLRRSVPVNVTVPAVAPSQAHEIVAASDCTTAKVKVGDPQDEARVEAVRDALGRSGRLRIDVNGAWHLDEAASRIKVLDRFDLEYVEQPVTSVEDMAKLRRMIDVRIAADESLRAPGGPERVISLEAADVAVLKVHPLGGVRRCLEIAERTRLPSVVSSALETSVGLAAGIALAAALPELPFACGLGTVLLLERDVVKSPLVPVKGVIDLRHPELDESATWNVDIGDALVQRLEAARSVMAE
jgi:o-succinylbenzoate synthase